MKNKPIEGAPVLGATTMDLTENCNLACDYCFTWRNGNSHDKSRVLKEDVGRKIIDWWLDQGDSKTDHNRNISWWGGEPFLEYELMQRLILYAEEQAKLKEYNINFGGTTNGLSYTPDKLEWCIKHDNLFLLSLDGVQPAHDLHRKTINGEGSWKIVDKNCREALKIFPQQKVRFSFAPDTLTYFFENIEYFYDMGLRDIAFSPVYEANWNEAAIELFIEESKKAFEFAIQKHKEGDPIIMKHYNDEAVLSDIPELPLQNPCGAGSGYGGWSIDGFYYPCHRFNKHNQTTKHRMKHKIPIIASIYKGWVNEEFRKQFWNFKNDPPKKCLECEIWRHSACNGGCYATNFDLTGSIKDPAWQMCAYSKAQHKVGVTYAKMSKEAGIRLKRSLWDGDSGLEGDTGCICYNMCYNEGTDREARMLDFRFGRSCLCYQARYSGRPGDTYEPLDLKREWFKRKFLDLTLRILLEAKLDKKKSKEQEYLESEVIDKTLILFGYKAGDIQDSSAVDG